MDRVLGAGSTTATTEPFTRVKLFEWFVCDVPGYEGFSVEIYVNQTIGEERAEDALWQQMARAEMALADAAKTFLKTRTTEDQGVLNEFEAKLWTAERSYLEFIAPRIKRWNLHAEDANTGEIGLVPAPADAGIEAFYLLETPILRWIKPKVHMAALGKYLSRMRQSGASELTLEPSPESDDPKTESDD